MDNNFEVDIDVNEAIVHWNIIINSLGISFVMKYFNIRKEIFFAKFQKINLVLIKSFN